MKDVDVRERHFDLERVHEDLATASVRSGVIATTGRGVLILVQLGAMMVLARILTPVDFGVLAMVMPVARLANTIGDRALQTSVIHQDILAHPRASALFRLSLERNALLLLGMAASGPLLAWIYDDDRVVLLAIAWAGTIFAGTLCSVHTALLKRQLRFAAVTVIQLTGVVLGSAVAIAAAWRGAGFWALLLQLTVWRVTVTALTWIVCDWRPTLRGPHALTGPSGTADFRRYWRGVSGYRLVHWLGDQADRVLTGAIAGAGPLGLYHVSRRWAWYPFQELFQPLSHVAIAGFSRITEGTQYRSYVRRALLPIFSLALPATAFIFVEAESIVLVLLGDQWIDAVIYMRLMAVAAFVGGVHRINEWIYLSRGDTGRQFRWSLLHTSVILAAVLSGSRWGPVGVATGFTMATCVLAIPSLAYAVRPSPLRTTDVLGAIARPAFAATSAAALMFGVHLRVARVGVPLFDLMIFGALYLVLFLLVWIATPGGRSALGELFGVLRHLRNRQAKDTP